MIDEADWSRLARYFADECSLDEANATRAWLVADEQRAIEAERLRALWSASAIPQFNTNSDSAWQRLSARMGVAEGLPQVALHQSVRVGTPPRFRWRASENRARRYGLVAAPFIVAAALLLMTRRDAVSKFWRTEVREPQSEKIREFRTARGQRAVVVLGDGSRVELGTESVLRVRPFRDSARVVWLEGQAVFDVVHDTSHAFFVHTKNAVTEDLGTRFSIRSYPTDNRVQVLVTSGKVALRAAGAPASSGTLLGPSDLGVLDSAGQTTVRNGVDSSSYLAWTRDRFVFDNAPLSDVLPEIARWFDVQITVENPALKQRRVTMNVPASSLRSVMGAATLPLGLRFSTDGRTVVVR
jgi:transmembrane sensor